jgi:D-alanine transaminase
MTRISFLNNKFLPHENCLIHIEDRGFQFADGAYEVTLFENGKLIDGDAHIERFFRSLREMKIPHNFTAEFLTKMQIDLFAKNNLSEGTCYIQVTRGFANRVPYFPKDLEATISATVSPRKKMTKEEFANGFSFMTCDDIRWKRCDIKSVALFPSSMMNQDAKNEGFDDAILVRDGFVTEGTFANIFIVDKNETLITRAPDNFILQGITRNRLIELAKAQGIKVEERSFAVEEMLQASEVFLTSSSLLVRPAREINGNLVGGDGKNRKIATILINAYDNFIAS